MGIFSVQDPSNGGSLFRTQANTQFNSFQDPIQTMNIGGPGWGINSNQMTPSYSAPYRPGGQEDPINSPRPGFLASVHNQFNPFAGNGYGRMADPFWGQQQYRESMYGRPMDAGMWAAQNIGVGYSAFALAGKMKLAEPMAQLGSSFFGGAAEGIFGHSLATGTNIGKIGVAGARLGGAAAGGLFGGLVIPFIVGQGIISAADAVIFDPYVNSRQTARGFRENFSGTSFGGNNVAGNYTGRGIGFAASARMGGEVTHGGLSDFTFSNKEISGIASLASRAGLLDNINPKDFAKSITSITKQVAIIAAVANDPDFRNSIEIISKLRSAGVSFSQAGDTMMSIGSHASIAGISKGRMMQVMEQGQFLASANNITPIVGGMQSAQSMASFAAANRAGLISSGLLARMGGVEGAAQSAMSGVISGVQTPYMRAIMANQYLGGKGGSTGNISSDLSNFGAMVSQDPMRVKGAMGLHGGQMTSAYIKEHGINAVTDNAMNILDTTNPSAKKGGKTSPEVMYELLTGSMGMTHEAAQSIIEQDQHNGNRDFMAGRAAGIESEFRTRNATLMSSMGYDGMKQIGQTKYFGRSVWAGATGIVQAPINSVLEEYGKAADRTGKALDEFRYGQNFDDMKNNGFMSFKDAQAYRPEKTKDLNFGEKGMQLVEATGNTLKAILHPPSEKGFYEAVSAREGFKAAFGIESDKKSGGEIIDKYYGDLDKAGLTPNDFYYAMKMQIKEDSGVPLKDYEKNAIEKTSKARGTRTLTADMERLEKLHSSSDWGKATTMVELKKQLEGVEGNIALSSMTEGRADEIGDPDAIAKIGRSVKNRESELRRLQKDFQSSRVSASGYMANLNKLAADGQMDAANMQLEAAKLNYAAASAEHPSEVKEAAEALKKSPTTGSTNPTPATPGR